MNELIAMLVPVLGRALLHFLWQGLAIGLMAALLLHVLRDARPQLRYAVGCLALLACVLLPLTSVVLGLGATGVEPTVVPATAHALENFDATATNYATDDSPWHRIDAAMPLVVALWAAGASIFCLRIGIGALWLRRLRGCVQHPDQMRWQERLDTLASRFGLCNVSLRLVSVLDSPVAAGWLRPVVLLPTAVAIRMPVELVEALLAHELAHIRRHDYLVNLLQNLVEALLFYHPVVWWLSHRVRAEREHIADAMAAEAIGDPRRLARALSALSELAPTPRAYPQPAPAAHGGPLMSRIQKLLRPDQPRLHAGRVALPVLGVAAACIAFIAQAQIGKPDAAAKATPTATAAATDRDARHAAEARAAEAQAAAAEANAARAAASHARAQAAAAPRPRTHGFARIDSDSTREAFAIVRSGTDGMIMSGSTRDTNAIEVARARLGGDFVWFRRGDQAYVVTDPSLVARTEAAWRDSNALGSQMEALGREMEGHGAKMAALGGRMDELAGAHQPSPAMRQAQERMQALAEEQQQLAGQQLKLARDMRKADDAEREALEAKSERLSDEMEALGAQMEQQGKVLEAESAQLERNREPMEALGRQMEAASKPMEALGARMEVLGKRQEELVRKAERDTNELIAEAMRKGLAKPAPGSARTQ
ncbi:MAG TPA: M56 family metallopeptidase [Lysobacter sp.]|nr:M56 family metallopeptidase [Lysobacter sp.]